LKSSKYGWHKGYCPGSLQGLLPGQFARATAQPFDRLRAVAQSALTQPLSPLRGDEIFKSVT